jgi:hypothetical protein
MPLSSFASQTPTVALGYGKQAAAPDARCANSRPGISCAAIGTPAALKQPLKQQNPRSAVQRTHLGGLQTGYSAKPSVSPNRAVITPRTRASVAYLPLIHGNALSGRKAFAKGVKLADNRGQIDGSDKRAHG